jgi:hypothetical protein
MSKEERDAVEPSSFVGRTVQIEVDQNDDGYPVVRRWRQVQGGEESSEKETS